ncbi:MAG: pilus assembly protein [Anaerolineae bacterium]|nr:pilus assembly protein [Anaerolineae bacterium]
MAQIHLPKRSRGSREQGQSLTEFALVMPLLIVLLVAVIFFAWIGFSYVSITSAARQGARHMMTYPTEPKDPDRFATADQEITYMITSAMPFLSWQDATITISPPVEDREPIVTVVVHVQYPLNLPTIRIPYVVRPGEWVLLPPIVLNAESRMKLIE